MIQRVQSIFLLISLIFLSAMFFVPVATIEVDRVFYSFTLNGFANDSQGLMPLYALLIFGLLICWLQVAIILLYRWRVLQMRLCIYGIILTLGLLGVMLYTIDKLSDASYFSLPIVFPVVSAILQYLAFRGIRKDELLVKMSNRLR